MIRYTIDLLTGLPIKKALVKVYTSSGTVVINNTTPPTGAIVGANAALSLLGP